MEQVLVAKKVSLNVGTKLFWRFAVKFSRLVETVDD